MKYFAELWRYMLFIKHYAIAAGLIFLAGILLGLFNSEQFSALLERMIKQLMEMVEEAGASNNGLLSLFWLIFLNNMRASFTALFSGLFFGIVPITTLLVNGLLLGYLLGETAQNGSAANAVAMFVKGILPHGIIELPAVILACAFGIRLGALVLMSVVNLFRPAYRGRTRQDFKDYFKAFLPFSVLLSVMLLAAAVIECTLTYWLVQSNGLAF